MKVKDASKMLDRRQLIRKREEMKGLAKRFPVLVNSLDRDIGFQIMILAKPERGIRVRRTYKYVVEDSDR